jgi:hypothetical protein
MDNPRKSRVVEQHFLNLPGFHAGAYVRAYVEDTSDQEVRLPDGKREGWAPTPRLVLEIADCTRRIDLEFDIHDAEDRLNSFHKIDTLIAALEAFHDGMVAEAALRRARLREIERSQAQTKADAGGASAAAA